MSSVSLLLVGLILLVIGAGVAVIYFTYKYQAKKIQTDIEKLDITPNRRYEVPVQELENTEAGRKLLDIYRRPYEYIKDYAEPRLLATKRTNIVLWGSVGSGKSWLIAALGACFYKYNSSEVIYTLTSSVDGSSVIDPFEMPQRPQATSSPSSNEFYFMRRFRNTGISSRVSSQLHAITVFDTMGGAAESSDYSQYQNEILENADCVILTLDHTRLKFSNGDFDQSKIEFNVIKRAFDVFNNRMSGVQPHVAICLTKIDLVEDGYKRDPLEIVKTIFGDEMYKLILKQPNSKVFATSAMGYLSEEEPQSNDKFGELLDASRWEPFGVEFPFFWLFQEITKEQIKKNVFNKFLYKIYFAPYPEAK